MNILVSNDDGYQAKGIRELVKALSEKGDVYVFAPDSQRSASSHAISVSAPVTVTEIDFPYAKKAWKLSGTPADCSKMGLDIMAKQGIDVDIVYAGINHGANLGTDTMYSGTVSAAAEGMFEGLPAVAVSVASHEAKYFEAACLLAVDVMEEALKTAGRGTLININTPNLPKEQIKGVKAARLGNTIYDEWLKVAGEREDGSLVYEYTGCVIGYDEMDEDVDLKLVHDGYSTISMIKYDLNDYNEMEKLKNWGLLQDK